METFLIKAVQLILALAILVIVHEFGHYFFARVFGIRVEKFYLFFNPWFSLFKWKPKAPTKRKKNKQGVEKTSWRDTEYGIGWVPLGGYCKIAGMIDESMDKEQMAQPAKPDEFRARPAYQRLLVMVGGVLFNFIFACLIYIGITWYWGDRSIPFENAYAGMEFCEEAKAVGYQDGDIILLADGEQVKAKDREAVINIAMAKEVTLLRGNDTVKVKNPDDFAATIKSSFMAYRTPVFVKQVQNGTPAEEAGLEVNDHIIAINGVATPSFSELSRELDVNKEKTITVTVERNGQKVDLTATPDSNGKLGFGLKNPDEIYDVETIKYNFFEAIPKGISIGSKQLVTYVSSLKMLFTKSGATQIGGFGAIGNLFPDSWDWRTFWEMAALLSVILAFMNILPIPALDGGHVLFVLWEIITRRKPSEKFLERAQICGMIFLLLLLLYANGNDIYRFIFK
ncbi:MAG: RIP metalloprotease RseP [Muribaculaceae bacterium]|nr:RIP metalloprotease RseP [Muribaculaceae bacterium]